MATIQSQRPLPPGWRWARLGEVCEIIAGQSPPGDTYRKVPEGLPFFQGKADFGLWHPVAQCWCVAPTKIALPGDILISVRAPVGPTNVADAECCIGRGLSAIRPRAEVDRDFVLAALKLFEGKLEKLGSGSTFGAIKRDDLESIEIPFPSVEEQRRIATILNDQMAAVERARAAAETQLEAGKALPASYLRAVFSSPEAQKWLVRKLGDVGEIVSGVTLGRKLNGAETRRVPYLRVANVKDGYLSLSDVYEIEATEAEIAKCTLRAGDLLLTEGGDPDKLGRGTFWQDQIAECIHQNHIFRVRLNPQEFSPEFVSAQVGSPYGKAYFLTHAKQTTGIATINQKVLGSFPLLVPPLADQRRIAEMLNERITSAERTRKAIEEELETVNKLPAALLRRACNGEL